MKHAQPTKEEIKVIFEKYFNTLTYSEKKTLMSIYFHWFRSEIRD